MAKKAEKKIDGDTLSIKFLESDQELSIDINTIPAEIISRLAMHGLSQKIGDSYAGAEPGESYDRAAAVLKDLQEGNWSTRVAASGPRTTQLAEALAAATEQTLEAAAARIEQMDDEEKKALRTHPVIKAQLATIKARKAQEAAEKAAAGAVDAGPLTL